MLSYLYRVMGLLYRPVVRQIHHEILNILFIYRFPDEISLWGLDDLAS
jgi:hypothetical protein